VHSIVRSPKIYKPLAVKRVWIPKKDNSKQPLGIPAIVDRVVKAVYLEAIDLLVKCNAGENSFGFRKVRSAQDAVLALKGKSIHPKPNRF
jgi:RNA-directed DNA polymerase